MRIASFNANSIRMRLPVVLEWLARHRPDALGIQETKAADADFPLAPLRAAGYHVAFRGAGGQSGVALLTRAAPDEVRFGFDDGEEGADPDRLVCARLGRLRLLNCYVPQGRALEHPMFAYKLRWFRRLRAFLERHATPRQRVALIGDLNVAPEPPDIYNSEKQGQHVGFHPDARAALAHLRDWGFQDVFRRHHPEPGHYTYFDYRMPDAVSAHKGWRVDLIYATRALAARSTDAWIDLAPRRGPQPSDHTFVAADFAL